MTRDATTADASTAGRTPVLAIRGLTIAFGRGADANEVVHGIDLEVARGEILALVGESGSGKSVTARAALGLVGGGIVSGDASVAAEHFELDGIDVRRATQRQWRHLRGAKAGLVLQDALVSLDPLRPIGREIGDALRLHGGLRPAAARARAIELLELVGMPHPELTVDRRSGELSGGMRQRALIAAALALDPPLVIADEPTTALDVGVQARVLRLLREAAERGAGVLLISHDLAVVSQVADRVAVLDAGRIVEHGAVDEVLRAPQDPVTQGLLAAVPTAVPRTAAMSTAPPILEASGLVKQFSAGGATTRAVDDVSLSLQRGQTLGLVGESGSGKTTLARLLLALTPPDAGTVLLDGEPWSALRERERRARRRRIGAIWQDPYGSFDPRWGVERLLRDALAAGGAAAERREVVELLDQVHLSADFAARHPLELSGGQRQRVAIARAIAARPELLICDEPVSALDVTVQARVLDLLNELQREHGLALLMISHDLGVVRHMSDELAVMHRGRIVESGPTEQVFQAPQHEYTAALIRNSPRLEIRG